MSDITRAHHWRQRAEELRTIADGMRTNSAKAIFRGLADSFDGMAQRLEQRISRDRDRAASVC